MLKNLLLLSGFSTFVVICIIGLNIYHNYTITTLPDTTQQHVKSIPPSFDKNTLEELKKREPVAVSLTEKSSVISEDTRPIEDESTPTPSPSVVPATPRTSTNSASVDEDN